MAGVPNTLADPHKTNAPASPSPRTQDLRRRQLESEGEPLLECLSMKGWVVVVALLALGCGETSAGGAGGTSGTGGSAGTGGTAGTGGIEPPPPPESVDQTCRAWCANEFEGPSCHQGPFESVQPCYEDCLSDYQEEEADSQCGDDWIAIKDCELDLECEDLFGDCDSLEDAHDECVRRSNARAFCTENCPELDISMCERDPTLCQQLLSSTSYCAANCPTQDLEECIQEHTSTGTCAYRDATTACRTHCTLQDLSVCVDQWLGSGSCDFDDGRAACTVLCPEFSGNSYCWQYWEDNGVCPDSIPPPPPPPVCISPPETMCSNGSIDPVSPCCSPPAPPNVPSVCTGTESVVSPSSCTQTGAIVTHQLTLLEIVGDCNDGYDLDGCDGTSCINGGLAPGEGTDGTDNALAGLAPVLAGVGGNLGGVNQAFSDSLCGLTGDECNTIIPKLDLAFQIDTNLEENCATVRIISNEQTWRTVRLNVSNPVNGSVCASGRLGAVPFELAGDTGTFDNSVVRMTVSAQGFSDGVMGATLSALDAVAIAEALLEGAGAVVGQVLDINSDLSGNNEAGCNALSGTYKIGGVVQ